MVSSLEVLRHNSSSTQEPGSEASVQAENPSTYAPTVLMFSNFNARCEYRQIGCIIAHEETLTLWIERYRHLSVSPLGRPMDELWTYTSQTEETGMIRPGEVESQSPGAVCVETTHPRISTRPPGQQSGEVP